MSTYFFDLDGVIFKYGKNELNEGAKELLSTLKEHGHSVVFTTYRMYENNNPPELNLNTTIEILKKENIHYSHIIGSLESPRIVINDEGAGAINYSTNEKFSADFIFKLAHKERLIKKTYDILASIAWCSVQHGADDMDDYIQTLLIGESLIANRGFNHRDIVRRYRTKPGHIIRIGRHIDINDTSIPLTLSESGASHVDDGRIGDLIKSFSLDYIHDGTNGFTDGSAMKVACIAPFYLGNFEELVKYTDKITKITHNFVDGRLAALLIVLRFRQLLLEREVDSFDFLKNSLMDAIAILGIGEESRFFLELLERCGHVLNNEEDPAVLLKKLNEVTGIIHFANSAPIAACIWSFKAKNDPIGYSKIFARPHAGHGFSMGDIEIEKNYTAIEMHIRYFEKSGVDKRYLSGRRKSTWYMDMDTFQSISFSLLAAKYGLGEIEKDIKNIEFEFSDNLEILSRNLIDISLL